MFFMDLIFMCLFVVNLRVISLFSAKELMIFLFLKISESLKINSFMALISMQYPFTINDEIFNLNRIFSACNILPKVHKWKRAAFYLYLIKILVFPMKAKQRARYWSILFVFYNFVLIKPYKQPGNKFFNFHGLKRYFIYWFKFAIFVFLHYRSV